MDLVALFEEMGFARPVDKIRLSDAQRAELLARIRDGQSVGSTSDDDLVEREVVASMRIEGVDARPWRPLRS